MPGGSPIRSRVLNKIGVPAEGQFAVPASDAAAVLLAHLPRAPEKRLNLSMRPRTRMRETVRLRGANGLDQLEASARPERFELARQRSSLTGIPLVTGSQPSFRPAPVLGGRSVIRVTAARRSPWLDDRTGVLLDRLAAHHMTLPEEAARQVISDHLDGTATLMRIGRQAAKFYVTDDVIRKIADQLLGIDAAQGEPDVVSLLERRRRKHR
jgi:hypothetical protein